MKNILINYTKKGGIFLTFILILSFFFSQDFFVFYKSQEEQKKQVQQLEKIQDFSLSRISEFEKTTLIETPDESLINDIVSKIEKTTNKLYLNSYIFTEKRIKKALIEAKKRGVVVKIILEKNVYNAPNVNAGTYEEMQKNGVEIVWANAKNFSLNHAKYIVFDDVVLVSTGNYSYSNFTKKRDFFVYVTDAHFKQNMESLFEKDFSGERTFFYQSNSLLSSFDVRQKFEKIIEEAQKYILIYAPYLQDENMVSLLESKLSKGIQINIITNVSEKKEQDIQKLQSKGAKISFSTLEIHAKSIDIDGKVVYIGSTNFSASGIDKNREVGLLLPNADIVKQFEDIFYRDFHVK